MSERRPPVTRERMRWTEGGSLDVKVAVSPSCTLN
jgi:hypothetical protein